MQLQIFKYQSEEEQLFNEIRTIEQEDGSVLFGATDVAKMLGYSNPHDAIGKHCRYLAKYDLPHPQSPGKTIKVGFIPEGDVYRLIVRSKLPNAEKFEKWLFDEVVPSIRKRGYYGKIDRTALPNFIERYKENYHKLPRDYFSVISEMYARLYMELEKVGYIIPDKGEHGKQMMPDISVGRGFASFLKRHKSEFYDTAKTYIHTFPDGREVEANMYHIDALPMFIRYINEDWIPNRATEYFKKRDPLALDYLPKLLGVK
nr:MAG TPA: repressor domain protein [Caudoviricetes sp.]